LIDSYNPGARTGPENLRDILWTHLVRIAKQGNSQNWVSRVKRCCPRH